MGQGKCPSVFIHLNCFPFQPTKATGPVSLTPVASVNLCSLATHLIGNRGLCPSLHHSFTRNIITQPHSALYQQCAWGNAYQLPFTDPFMAPHQVLTSTSKSTQHTNNIHITSGQTSLYTISIFQLYIGHVRSSVLSITCTSPNTGRPGVPNYNLQITLDLHTMRHGDKHGMLPRTAFNRES